MASEKIEIRTVIVSWRVKKMKFEPLLCHEGWKKLKFEPLLCYGDCKNTNLRLDLHLLQKNRYQTLSSRDFDEFQQHNKKFKKKKEQKMHQFQNKNSEIKLKPNKRTEMKKKLANTEHRT